MPRRADTRASALAADGQLVMGLGSVRKCVCLVERAVGFLEGDCGSPVLVEPVRRVRRWLPSPPLR